VRAFIDFLASHVASMRHVLSGKAASR
jgi:hypothetical protein